MQYRIQFLDGSANVLREWSAYARSVASAVSLVADIDWITSGELLKYRKGQLMAQAYDGQRCCQNFV